MDPDPSPHAAPETLAEIRGALHARSGLALDPSKDYLLEARLQPVARQFGLASLEELAARLPEGPTPLVRAAVDAVLRTGTAFFEEPLQFDALRDVVLPPLIERRGAEHTLRLWSASTGTGQEAYSLAILLREHFAELRGWDVQVVATDLSVQSLRRAREGRYSQLELNRGVPPRLIPRHFRRDGLDWRVHPDLGALVEFRTINLAKRTWPELPRFDVIFLRGALGYFDAARRREILRRVNATLAPDGFLFLGPGDAAPAPADGFEPIAVNDALFFRPIAAAAEPPAPLPASGAAPDTARPGTGAAPGPDGAPGVEASAPSEAPGEPLE